MAKILGNKEKLISTYFYSLPRESKQTDDVFSYHNNFENVDEYNINNQMDNNHNLIQLNQRNYMNNNFINNTNYVDSTDSMDQLDSDSLEDHKLYFETTNDFLYFKYLDLFNSENSTKGNWKIKFLLLPRVSDPSLFTQLSNKLMITTSSWLSLLPEFGFFHTALIVGPHKIEWLDTSICIPRAVLTMNPVFLIDICTIKDANHYISIREKLAERIAWWNENMKYSKWNSSNWLATKSGNCQHFVNDIIQHLGLVEQFEKKLEFVRPVLNRIIQQGDIEMEIILSRPFYELFPICQEDINEMLKQGTYFIPLKRKLYSKNMKIHFISHKQLDLYIGSLLNFDRFILLKDFDEIQILKSFDRAFWLHKNKHETLKSLDPNHIIPESCFIEPGSCPFQAPDLTNSIMQMPETSFKEAIEEYTNEIKQKNLDQNTKI